MHSAKMETACRKMAESYVDYEMTGRNLGMCEHLDKEHFYRLTRGYFEAAVRNGSLYCAGANREGYFNFETPETKRSLSGSLLQATWSLRAFGLKKGIRYVKEIMNSGTYLASEFGRQKKPFTKIEFIAVAKEHQGQGYMRQMMEYAFSESDRLGLPLILTTDDPKKVEIYEHFGMKMVREHIVSDRAVYYEMLRE
jgi:GNAT superfamily N-acetyltransferase